MDKEPLVEEPEEKEELSEVVVDLDKPESKETKPEEKQDPPKLSETKLSPDLSKLNNTIAYQTRKLEQAMRELAEIKREMSTRTIVPKEVKEPQDLKDLDEIDEIAQKDWKQGVKKVVEKDIEARIGEAFDKRERAQAEYVKKA